MYCLSEIVAFTFLVDYCLIDSSGGNAVGPCGDNVGEALIMSEVEVGFKSVVGDVALSMFVWIECAGIYIQIWVKLLDSDSKSS